LRADSTRYSAAYKRGVTLLLMSAYTCNSMDRSLISIVGQPMKTDLGLTDSQLGLLGGTAFALLYAFGGIPVARLAERFNRVNIITIALILWSSLSALCGAAAGFPQLLLTRMGVGIAEAGCSPPAHSLISDFYEPAERTSALSVYSCGTSLGYLSAAVLGGYVAQKAGWRTACFMVGIPGIVIALLIKSIIREPPRGYSDTLQREPVARSVIPASRRPRRRARHRRARPIFAAVGIIRIDRRGKRHGERSSRATHGLGRHARRLRRLWSLRLPSSLLQPRLSFELCDRRHHRRPVRRGGGGVGNSRRRLRG
jgi:MFS family permease